MEILAVSDEVLIYAIGAVVTIVGAWLGARQAAKTAVEAQAKQFILKIDTAALASNLKMNEIAGTIEEVRHATNSMKDELVKATEKEALARGGSDERARANLEQMHKSQDDLADVNRELSKLTSITDGKVDEVGDAVDEVDDKVEEVRDAVGPKDKES